VRAFLRPAVKEGRNGPSSESHLCLLTNEHPEHDVEPRQGSDACEHNCRCLAARLEWTTQTEGLDKRRNERSRTQKERYQESQDPQMSLPPRLFLALRSKREPRRSIRVPLRSQAFSRHCVRHIPSSLICPMNLCSSLLALGLAARKSPIKSEPSRRVRRREYSARWTSLTTNG